MTDDTTQSAARSKFRVIAGSVFGLLALGAGIVSIRSPASSLPVDPVSFTIAIVLATMTIAFVFFVPVSRGVENV